MTWIAETLLVLAVALAVDRLVGDPAWLWRRAPHPVVLMGRAVAWLDAELNKPELSFADRRRRGVLALVVLAACAAALGWVAEALFRPGPLGLAVESLVVAVFLAQKSLVDHVAAVEQALRSEGLEGGRHAVAEIVGRDVSVLDEAGVARAAIESAAENFSDGVVAPALLFLLLGLPGLLVFKLVNTADSMVGNRSPRHEAFGWASARVDDVLNFIPARISALLIAAAASLSGRDGQRAMQSTLKDAPRHKSPNAGWPEAALAGALGLALGGPRRYGDIAVDGAWLNEPGRRDVGPRDISDAIGLVDAAWMLLAAATAIAAVTGLVIAR